MKLEVENVTDIQPRQTATSLGSYLILNIDINKYQIENFIDELYDYYGYELFEDYFKKEGYELKKKNSKP